MLLIPKVITKIFFGFFLTLLIFVFLSTAYSKNNLNSGTSWWEVQSIDTMKYSRDPAAEKLNDKPYETEIEIQVTNIAKTGATHVAIATPYDEKFLPFLKKWVAAARRNNLKVWYRGNWSNWEGWFGFEKKMTFDEHIQKSVDFIKKHPDLFEDGDSFTACPECENGAAGDPRQTGKVFEYRNFLIRETSETAKAFKSINKKVATNWLSMNGDIARLIMDKETVEKTGGIISIDHYVKTPEQLNDDVDRLVKNTGAKIFFGEFGAPIPDIHGRLSDEDQAAWIDRALDLFSKNPNVVGINYWVNKGGSSELWKPDNTPKRGVEVLKKYYSPKILSGVVRDNLGKRLDKVLIKTDKKNVMSNNGSYIIPVLTGEIVEFTKKSYKGVKTDVKEDTEKSFNKDIVMEKIQKTFWDELFYTILHIFNR